MTDPKIVAREIIFGEWHDHTTVWKKMRPEHLKLHEQRIAKAIEAERTTAYKAGMERAGNIANRIMSEQTDPQLAVLAQRIKLEIRAEANKEIK